MKYKNLLLKILFPKIYQRIVDTGFWEVILDPKTKLIQAKYEGRIYDGSEEGGEEISSTIKLTKTSSENRVLCTMIEFKPTYKTHKRGKFYNN